MRGHTSVSVMQMYLYYVMLSQLQSWAAAKFPQIAKERYLLGASKQKTAIPQNVVCI